LGKAAIEGSAKAGKWIVSTSGSVHPGDFADTVAARAKVGGRHYRLVALEEIDVNSVSREVGAVAQKLWRPPGRSG